MRTISLASIAIFVSVAMTSRADWPAFRGPGHQGQGGAGDFPVKWGPQENVAWKVKLPGHGASSPVVAGERVFVTCFTGKKGPEIVRHLLCVERKTGKLLWEQKRPALQPESDYSGQRLRHGLTTPTPIIDGERIYVNYCRGGVYCFDLDGKEIWHREIGSSRNSFGSGASPSIHGDLVLVNATIESSSFMALNKKTGEVVWKTRVFGDCWATPVVVETEKGDKEIVLNCADALRGFDPADGKELWKCDSLGGYVSTTPLIHKDVLYIIASNFGQKGALAVRAGGRGDVTKTHVLWTNNKVGASYTSPLLIGERIFYFSGQATCINRATGEIVTQKSLDGIKNAYSSPIAANGKIYLFTRDEGAYVLSADEQMSVIAHNVLGDTTAINASPAATGTELFIRSQTHLYCLRKK